jgi:hypothetical protein
LGGSSVFLKQLMGPIKWTIGYPHLHLFMEKKNPTVSNIVPSHSPTLLGV